MYSTKSLSCKNVFPHRIVRPLGKKVVDNKEQLRLFLNDVTSSNENQIKHYVADNPKRADAKGCMCASARHACEYCFEPGVNIDLRKKQNEMARKELEAEKQIILDKIASLQERPSTSSENDILNSLLTKIEKRIKDLKVKKSHIVWPASTMNGDPRTRAKILEIVEKIENGELSKEESKGIKSRSPLLALSNFDIVRDVPTEYLHAVCIGVVKRLVELCFAVGEKRPSDKKTKLCPPQVFNNLMASIKVVFEFSRRVRDLDLSVMKGQEYRNVVLFFFPVVVKCLDHEQKERKIWLLLSFLIRACVLPTKEFQCVNLNSLYAMSKQFYQMYDSHFGKINCTYNTHIVGSHIIEMRSHGPLTFTSAFVFENFYGELRRSFAPGTQSTIKQMLQKILVKRAITSHCCENSIHLSDYDTALECNSLVYVFKDLAYKFYKIRSINGEHIQCQELGKYEYTFIDMPTMDWKKVGVFEKGPLSSEIITIRKNSIHGKVIQVDNLLLTCPNNVLREK